MKFFLWHKRTNCFCKLFWGKLWSELLYILCEYGFFFMSISLHGTCWFLCGCLGYATLEHRFVSKEPLTCAIVVGIHGTSVCLLLAAGTGNFYCQWLGQCIAVTSMSCWAGKRRDVPCIPTTRLLFSTAIPTSLFDHRFLYLSPLLFFFSTRCALDFRVCVN